MTKKEIIELKLEIYNELKNCLDYNFLDKTTSIDIKYLNNLILKNEYLLKGIEINENQN